MKRLSEELYLMLKYKAGCAARWKKYKRSPLELVVVFFFEILITTTEAYMFKKRSVVDSVENH